MMLTPARMILHWCQVPQPQSWSLTEEPSPSLLPSHQTLRPPPDPAGSWGVEAGYAVQNTFAEIFILLIKAGEHARTEPPLHPRQVLVCFI